eukprot:3186022-Karenia_brevis.AAC.1
MKPEITEVTVEADGPSHFNMATSAVDVISFNAANSGDAAAGADMINHSAAMVTACDASSPTLAAGMSSPVLFGCGDAAFDAMTPAAGKSSP